MKTPKNPGASGPSRNDKPAMGRPYKSREGRPDTGRPRSDKAYGDKTYGDKTHSDKTHSDKAHNDKTRGDKPYGDRAGKPRGKRPFQKPDPASRPADQFEAKKPFHSDEQRAATAEHLAALNERMPGLAARRVALDVLARLRAGDMLDQALTTTRTFALLEGSDRGFARNLISHALRRRGSLDEVIGNYLDKPLPLRAIEAMDILRITAAQLLILNTPAHAAVATATELAGQKQELQGYKGLVNAISRRISEKGKAQWEKLADRVDTPGWLWRSWERHYGIANTRAMAAAHAAEPPLDLTLRDPSQAASVAEQLGGIALANGTVRLASGNITQLPGFETGDFWAQDVAASLPVRLLGDIAGKTVFDLCAAPGGKTMQLAAAGARVIAVDRVGMRLKLLQENLTRMNLVAETICADLTQWQAPELADAILLDAPCSSTGTLRRNPDIAWARKEEEIEPLALLQDKMIDHAAAMLKPGGLLVFVTCSLQKREGEDHVASALERNADLELVAIEADELGGEDFAACIHKQGWFRSLPSHLTAQGGMDGFFAMRLRKKV